MGQNAVRDRFRARASKAEAMEWLREKGVPE
jgi:hypothetical protein